MNAEIVAIGSELLTPFRQDTNSLFLTRRLNELGVEVIFKTIVGDRPEHLLQASRIALSRAHIVIFSGGLGPTEDDLTRECVAQALGLELRRESRDGGRALHPCRSPAHSHGGKQRQAGRLHRRRRAAEELARQRPRAVAGHSLRRPAARGDSSARPSLRVGRHVQRPLLRAPQAGAARRTSGDLRVEDRDGGRIHGGPARGSHLQGISRGRNHHPGASRRGAISSQGAGATQQEAEERVEKLASLLEDEFADEIFSSGGESLEQIVGYFLQMRGATLSVAESCTGGLLAERITRISGSSRYFMGGALVYSDQLKREFCGVPPLLLASDGAVSRPVAAALAEGIRQRCKTTLGIGITGIAGPGGGTNEKPVGLGLHRARRRQAHRSGGAQISRRP